MNVKKTTPMLKRKKKQNICLKLAINKFYEFVHSLCGFVELCSQASTKLIMKTLRDLCKAITHWIECGISMQICPEN